MTKDLWKLAEQKLNEIPKPVGEIDGSDKDPPEAVREESTVILLGSKDSGKTSMVLRFLDRDEPTRPTIALEYTFGRRNRENTKEVGHIWELGGGTLLLNLLDVPLNQRTIKSLSIVLLVDLSKPEEMWVTLESCLTKVNSRLDEICKQNPDMARRLKNLTWKRFGEDHADKELITPCQVPLAIVGCKYDVYQDMDTEQKKIISKTLRFIAHTNAASLLFLSSRVESLVTKGRALLSQLVFGTSGSKQVITDPTKPISIPFGADNFSDIGPPTKIVDGSALTSAGSPVQLWKNAFCTQFPQKDFKKESTEDPSKDPQYAEKSIDLIREQKDQELEKVIRERAMQDRQLQRNLQKPDPKEQEQLKQNAQSKVAGGIQEEE